jgi:hypothetical protein
VHRGYGELPKTLMPESAFHNLTPLCCKARRGIFLCFLYYVHGNTGGGVIGTGTSGTNVPDPTPIIDQTIYTATCSTDGSNVISQAIVNVTPSFQEF